MRSSFPALRTARPLDLDIGVVYTHERDLMPRLLSTLASSGSGLNMRLILVDNASADGIEAWRPYFPDMLALRNERRALYAANLNRVLGVSTARYALLLNTDMYFDPQAECLLRMVEFMDHQRDCGTSGCALYHDDGSFAYPARRFQNLPILLARRLGLAPVLQHTLDSYLYRDRDPAASWQCDWLSGCFLMIRREAFQDVGFFDEGFGKYFEDVDLCYRMARSGWRVMYHGATLGYHLEQRASRQILSIDAARHLRAYLRWHWKWGFSYQADLPQGRRIAQLV